MDLPATIRGVCAFLRLSHVGQDLRYAFRSMGCAPGFTLCAVATLALGIGSNTAVFSVVNAVLVRPLNYPDPSHIVQFFLSSSEGSAPGASIPDLRFWLERVDSVQEIAAYDFDQAEMGFTSGTPEQVHGLHVTSNYFRLFGAPVLLGRTFSQADNLKNGPKVVVLSYRLWRLRFGGDEHIIGAAISLNKESYTVIGVTGESFNSEPEAQLWIPFQFDLNSTDQFHSFAVAGRLKPGVTLDQANAQLDAVSQSARRLSELSILSMQTTLTPTRRNHNVSSTATALLRSVMDCTKRVAKRASPLLTRRPMGLGFFIRRKTLQRIGTKTCHNGFTSFGITSFAVH